MASCRVLVALACLAALCAVQAAEVKLVRLPALRQGPPCLLLTLWHRFMRPAPRSCGVGRRARCAKFCILPVSAACSTAA